MSILDLWAKPRVQFLQGDSRAVLPTLPAKTFHCCVTSPPYFGLRDYGHDGQIGLEQTPQAYVDELVAVFREVRRVLRDDGTLWLNIGDCMKNKRLLMIPNRLAIALSDDGWFVRSEIIWHKPNAIPDGAKDRPTSAHEKLWLLSKTSSYFFDAQAIAVPAIRAGKAPGGNKKTDATRMDSGRDMTKLVGETRNIRNVWSIAPAVFKGAHFATFPPALIEPCILAGCPVGGAVLDPFGVAGTTGLVAQRLKRDATLVELNPDYVELARRRVSGG